MYSKLDREGHIYRSGLCMQTEREQRVPGTGIPVRLKDRCIRRYQSISEDRSLWSDRGLPELNVSEAKQFWKSTGAGWRVADVEKIT